MIEVKFMKNIIGGICVGIANIIPGVSGGTIIVLMGLFDKLMESISNVFNFKIKLKDKKESFIFLLEFLLGAGIGLVGFAKILEFLFVSFEVQTLYWFIGLILCSVPILKKNELKGEKINWLFLIIGCLIIGLITYLAPGEEGNIVKKEVLLNQNLTIGYLIMLAGLGAIGGASMMFPGVSGSMVLLVLGKYHLFKGYVANVTSFDTKIIIPIIFIGIGVILGIVVSAIITNYLLKHYKRNIMSLILGLIIASAISIIPTSGYNITTILTSIITFIFGAFVIYFFDKKENS